MPRTDVIDRRANPLETGTEHVSLAAVVPHDATFNLTTLANVGGGVTATMPLPTNPLMWDINMGAVGAGRACWVGEAWTANGTNDPYSATNIGAWGRLHVAEAWVQFNQFGSAATPETKAGISFGFNDLATIAASPARALACLYARPENGTWELLTARGNSSARQVDALVGVDAPGTGGAWFFLQIVHNIGDGYVAVSVNGVEGFRSVATSKMPLRTSSLVFGTAAFMQGGTDAGAQWEFVVFNPTRQSARLRGDPRF